MLPHFNQLPLAGASFGSEGSSSIGWKHLAGSDVEWTSLASGDRKACLMASPALMAMEAGLCALPRRRGHSAFVQKSDAEEYCWVEA